MEALPDKLDEAIRAKLQTVSRGVAPIDIGTCPDEEELTCYVERLLGARATEQIERHFVKCRRCSETVVLNHRVREAVGDVVFSPVPEPVLEQMLGYAPAKRRNFMEAAVAKTQEFAKSLRHWGDALPFWNLQPAALRGASVDEARGFLTLRRSFRTFKAVIRIERIDDNLCEVKVSVYDRANRPMQNGVRVSILAGDRELASYALDQGDVLFEDLQPGAYVIRISNQKLERGEVPINIKGE